jgi:hypothetical protein
VLVFDRKAQVSLAAYFVGRRDDSTLLSDPFFGTSLLLPNRTWIRRTRSSTSAASYQIHPRLRWY